MTKLRAFWQAIKEAGRISVPIYVTRKAADGMIGTWSISGLAAIVFLLLLALNVFLWGIAGIIVAVGVIL